MKANIDSQTTRLIKELSIVVARTSYSEKKYSADRQYRWKGSGWGRVDLPAMIDFLNIPPKQFTNSAGRKPGISFLKRRLV